MSREAKILIGILVVVVGGMIALFVFANSGSSPTPTADAGKLVRDNSQKTGTGSIQVVEFGDYQCPACGLIQPAVEQLLASYSDKVTFYFRDFPLPQHKNAYPAAEAAGAAGAQGKYWEMHNLLYAKQAEWSELADPNPKFIEYATSLGLDIPKFTKSINDKAFRAFIEQGTADGDAIKVNSTPTFYINGVANPGIKDFASLKAAVDAAQQAK